MGLPQPFALPISYGQTDAVRNSGGYLSNWEAEVAPKDARTPVTLRGSPGLALFTDTGDFPVVGMIEVNGAGYVVTKDALYRIFPDFGSFKLATFALGLRVRVATNGLAIVATDGLRAWSYTIQASEQAWYDASAPFVDYGVELTGNYFPASTVAFLNARLIFDRMGTNQFFNTGLLDLVVDAAAIKSAETSPDFIVGVIVDHQVLTVFNTKTTEFFYDSGVGFSPYQRVPGGVSEHGAASAYCFDKLNNNTFVVTPEGTVFAFQGYQPRPISTPAIEQALLATGALSTATGFCYTEAGRFYYQLTAGEFTACYDMSTGLWHQRSDLTYGRHRASCHMFVFGKNLVGHFDNGKVYEMSTAYFDNAGDPLPAILTTGPFTTGGREMGVPSFELEIDVGFGNASSVNPLIGLEMSKDDGMTFGVQRTRPLGAIGTHKTRVRWLKCGSGRDPRFRVALSDPVHRSMSSRAWVETK